MWVLFLLLVSAVAAVSCARLCQAAYHAAESAEAAETPGPGRRLTLYETAFLAGGPQRVTELTLVAMSRQRRLLLAHTGWATVVDPEGHDDIERSVITAAGPGGQSRIPPLRATVAAADAVRALSDGLAAAGLAVPDTVRVNVTGAVRQVRRAAVLILLTGLVAELWLTTEPGSGRAASWFAMPLMLTLGCLIIARFEVRGWTGWASPEGQRCLAETVRAYRDHQAESRDAAAPEAAARAPGDGPAPDGGQAADEGTGSGGRRADGTGERAMLTAFALAGPATLTDPDLRAALGGTASPLRGE